MARSKTEEYELIAYDDRAKGKTTTGQVFDTSGKLVTVYDIPVRIIANSGDRDLKLPVRRDRKGRLVYAG